MDLTTLKVKQLPENYFDDAMNILDEELGKDRVRDSKFLKEKFNKFPEFFIGVFLDKELVGIICGFPREDYLLISEIAIDSKFHNSGFGKKLIKEFEKVGFKEYNKINVGARDQSIRFYKSLGYIPFLLIQYNKDDYTQDNFSNLKIINKKDYGLEVKVEEYNLTELNKIRKQFPKANFQYIFSKVK
jgi:ribosomal protein S18 acetylase RimI-like enzyme